MVTGDAVNTAARLEQNAAPGPRTSTRPRAAGRHSCTSCAASGRRGARAARSRAGKNARIFSDQNPHYEPDVKKHFPEALYKTYKGRRGCVVGQGELKSGGFDPLFCLNHTAAMLRANMNRLFRRTWCTTKTVFGLEDHIAIYARAHNERILGKLTT